MRAKNFSRWLMLGVLALPLAARADTNDKSQGQTTNTTKNTTPTRIDATEKLSDTELQILAHVHQANQQEIQAGQLAEKQGATQGVKEYGQMLVTDHTNSDRNVLAFVKKLGQSLPPVTPMNEADKIDQKTNKQMMSHLRDLHGADFDREFLRDMAAAHDKTLAKLDADLPQVKHAELTSMLTDMKPVLQKHLDRARQLISAQPSS